MLFVKVDGIFRVLRKSLRKQKLRRLMVQFFIKRFGLQIVTRLQLTKNTKKYQTREFSSEELIFSKNLIIFSKNLIGILEEIPQGIQPTIGLVKLEKPFVAEIKNAQIVGPTAAGFDENKYVIEETLPSIDDLPTRALIAQKLFIAKTPKLDTACSLVNAVNHVYGHWITDCLMRIEGVEYYQKRTGRKPLLIINSNLRTWQIDSLKLLGYEPNDYVQWQGNLKKVNVKRLVVPSFRRQGTWIEPSACQWLKQRMLSNLPPLEKGEMTFSPRIYISRPKEAGRAVTNEDAVMEMLAPLGFVSYTLETLSFQEEVRLFSQAEIIIGTHGSGLINMIFSQKKPIIIDLFSLWYTNWFLNLSTSLGCQYRCLKCQPSEQSLKLTRGNMVVDIAKLKQLVEPALAYSN